jgi:predicted dithiol-disulfide oxidoreductase (DUF899 family)
MPLTFPGESAEYRTARERLLDQEIALRRQMESVAAARRALPPGGLVPEDYVFQGAGPNGAPAPVQLSELFAPGTTALAIYSMMFPRHPGDRRPNAATVDQLDGAAEHVAQHVNLVVVAKAPIAHVLAFAKERGWRRLRMLSAAGNTYSRDYHAEDAEGAPMPILNVFSRAGGAVRHFWGSELLYAPSDPGQDPRHVGTLEPSWNLYDLTREGRGEGWEEQIQYPGSRGCEHC